MPLEASPEDLSEVWASATLWDDSIIEVGDILIWRSLGGAVAYATYIIQSIDVTYNGKAAKVMPLTATTNLRLSPLGTLVFISWYDPESGCIIKVDNHSWKILGK